MRSSGRESQDESAAEIAPAASERPRKAENTRPEKRIEIPIRKRAVKIRSKPLFYRILRRETASFG